MKRRGSALGGTLLVMVLLFLFGLTLADLATVDLRLVNQAGQRQLAREAAEAGLNRVIALIGQDPTVGQAEEVFEETLPQGGSYRITFHPEHPHWSLNNLSNLNSAARGSDRTVPPNHCLIFAEGRSPSGEVALLESLVRLEALPYAVAGSQTVRSGLAGPVVVAGARTAQQAADGEWARLGSTYSGSSAADSTRFPAGSQVTGDVHAVGGAQVSGVNIGGELETGHDPVQLPNLTLSDFNTEAIPGCYLLPGGLLGTVVLPLLLPPGPVYIDGDATFVAVNLNDSTVYVDGNLQVVAMLGRGAVFVNGSTTFLANITLTGSDRITLFSEDDITVALAGIFQGVLYTHGNFTSGAMLLVRGAIYANNLTDPSKGHVELNGLNNTIVHVDEYTAFASYWLALGGDARPVQVYWNQLR
jgi:hypothetical protein